MKSWRWASPPPLLAALAGPATLAALFALLTAESWRRWSDAQIDAGREIYFAWALAAGKSLYVDVLDKNGPLPPYVNALWFRLFGDSIRTLAVCNLTILVAFVALVYRTCLRLTDRLTATLCGAVVLVASGIAQEIPTGNYNFITPYSHHQTHGLVLGALGVVGLERWLESGRARFAAGAGLCLGLVFLTKAELFVPIGAAAAVAWAVAVFGADLTARPHKALVPFLLGAVLPSLAFTAALATRMTLGTASDGVLGNWHHLGAGALQSPFYLAGMGLDHPLENIEAMLGATLVLSAAVLAAIRLDRMGPTAKRLRRIVGIVAGSALFMLLVNLTPVILWIQGAPRVLPLVCVAAVIGGAWWWHRFSAEAPGHRHARALTLWAVYGGLLLAKLGLLPRLYQYGFALALIGTLVAVALLVSAIPRWLQGEDGRGGDLFRALATATVLAFLFVLASHSRELWARKTVRVGEGSDTIWVDRPASDPSGAVMARGLARLREVVPQGGTLAVLPEGAFLNYWLRVPNSTPYLSLNPHEIEFAGGESNVLARFQAVPPDVIVLISRDGSEFGRGIFGVDPQWGKSLVDWVLSVYQPVETIGGNPLRGRGFGLTIFRRRSDTADP